MFLCRSSGFGLSYEAKENLIPIEFVRSITEGLYYEGWGLNWPKGISSVNSLIFHFAFIGFAKDNITQIAFK